MFLKQKCIILHKQISDMVADKQEEVAALEMKLQTLDKDLEWKKEVLSPIFFCKVASTQYIIFQVCLMLIMLLDNG